jgi:DNA modification methylase
MIELKDSAIALDEQNNFKLIYLDPPFFTQTEFNDFGDKWSCLDEYLAFIRKRIAKAHKALRNDGAIFIHCDWHASHYIKTICDEIFGYENFSCEIRTKRAAKNAVNITYRLFENTDSLLFYWKDATLGRILKVPVVPIEGDEERWSTLSAGGNGPPMYFGTELIYPPKGRHFMWSQVHITEQFMLGNIRLKTKSRNPEYRVLRDCLPLGTLWDDIPAYSKEWDYSTQKSTQLMERIITMVTVEGDRVGDFFCGSGTTCYVAKLLKREYYGCDINPKAIEITEQRLAEIISQKDILSDL